MSTTNVVADRLTQKSVAELRTLKTSAEGMIVSRMLEGVDLTPRKQGTLTPAFEEGSKHPEEVGYLLALADYSLTNPPSGPTWSLLCRVHDKLDQSPPDMGAICKKLARGVLTKHVSPEWVGREFDGEVTPITEGLAVSRLMDELFPPQKTDRKALKRGYFEREIEYLISIM